jgi:hypothetical protein
MMRNIGVTASAATDFSRRVICGNLPELFAIPAFDIANFVRNNLLGASLSVRVILGSDCRQFVEKYIWDVGGGWPTL